MTYECLHDEYSHTVPPYNLEYFFPRIIEEDKTIHIFDKFVTSDVRCPVGKYELVDVNSNAIDAYDSFLLLNQVKDCDDPIPCNQIILTTFSNMISPNIEINFKIKSTSKYGPNPKKEELSSNIKFIIKCGAETIS